MYTHRIPNNVSQLAQHFETEYQWLNMLWQGETKGKFLAYESVLHIKGIVILMAAH